MNIFISGKNTHKQLLHTNRYNIKNINILTIYEVKMLRTPLVGCAALSISAIFPTKDALDEIQQADIRYALLSGGLRTDKKKVYKKKQLSKHSTFMFLYCTVSFCIVFSTQ